MCAFKTTHPLTIVPEGGPPLDTLEGVIERITFHNEENGYTVARLLPQCASRFLPAPVSLPLSV